MEKWDSAVFQNMHLGGRDALCVVPPTLWKSAECCSDHGIVAFCVRRSVSGSRFFLKTRWEQIVAAASSVHI